MSLEEKLQHAETIKDIGCSFRVFRKRSTKNIITISLWKGNIGYIFNLSNTILWWGRNIETLYPGWNVRFYIDYSIFTPMKNDIDWNNVLNQLTKRKNVEIWLYFCEWGHTKDSKCPKCHTGTFGSMIRFHAFQDPTIETAISRNVEILTSPKIARIVHHFTKQPTKQFHIFYSCEDGYSCMEGSQDYGSNLCQKFNLENVNMVLATFGFKKNTNLPNPIPDLFTRIRKITFKHWKTLQKFPYGIDEIMLTLLYKPKMTQTNTYVTPRNRLNQYLPINDPNYNTIYKYTMDFLKLIPNITTPSQRKYFQRIHKYWPWKPYMTYQTRLNPQINTTIGQLIQENPELTIELLRYIKRQINPTKNEIKIIEELAQEMSGFMFALFQGNALQPTSRAQNNPEYNFLYRAQNPRQGELIFYMLTVAASFENIDFPGYLLKTKMFNSQRPSFEPPTDEQIEREIAMKKARYKRNPAMLRQLENTSVEELRQQARRNLLHGIEKQKKEYERNRQIFLHNIKQVYLFGNKTYE